MAQVIWTVQAIDDIDSIAEYISRNSFKYAQIQVSKFFSLSSILEHQPKAGRKVPETNDESIRELITGSYRIIYKIRHNQDIIILTIHHSSRLLSNNPNI